VELHYPNWVMAVALTMIFAGILPMPLVYLLRRFQILKVDLDIHQGSIRRNETTASTKEMIDQDDDVSAISSHIRDYVNLYEKTKLL
jgi:solute carrier family 6 amino acid/orphan transporter-like 15/16/17/18/20